jgi:tRNA pseudouridine38-40 synthase
VNSSGQPRPCRNILFRIAYDGTDFHGWQIQPNRATVQGILTSALTGLCGEGVHICGAGRTDAGVQAYEQAANALVPTRIPCPNLVRALNGHLPESIRVISAQEVSENFHARRDAQSKTYRYRIYRGAVCPPNLARYVWPFPYAFDEPAMKAAAPIFEGTWDFRPFASEDPSAPNKPTVRTVFSSRIERQGEELRFTVAGRGFLYHMVRIMMGTLVEIGRGRSSAAAVRELLASGQGTAPGSTAPARGLTLVRVNYDPQPSSSGVLPG